MVITGATSGIGLVTAREAAEAGVRLVLAARDRNAPQALMQELRNQGAEAIYVMVDVGRMEDVRSVAFVVLGFVVPTPRAYQPGSPQQH